jgi:FemAB-related protein (PEP-CTERM system-associated)
VAWRDVIARSFGHQSLYRVARREGQIAGILPLIRFANPWFGRYLVSMPYLNRGGILADSAESAAVLLADARRLLADTRSKYCELRHESPLGEDLPRRQDKVSMTLDVSRGADALWEGIGGKVRNLVRKAEKEGLTARVGDPQRDFDLFYRLFAENMRDLGTPVYAAAFFREILAVFADSARLSIVEKEGEPAAAAISLIHRGFCEIHWAAARREMLPFSPNMLLYWEAISHAARSGVRIFCFGRSTVGSGPHRFKKQWGAVPTALSWEYLLSPGQPLPALRPDNPKYRAAVGAWKRLPIGLTRILGPPIVRHIP